MKAGFGRIMACSLGLMAALTVGYLPAASAQDTAPPPPPGQPAPQDNPAPVYPPQQLDQLVAPIALYPDPLLAQTLMAATYPLEIVEASRWVQDPNNARLRGDQLDAALQPMDWDPSVKSLVPFPQILKMMDGKLDWTQALGNAFLAQQGDVMDAVQRLRAQAASAGTLQSTAQQTVSNQGQTIVIEPANPQTVYVPYYNPTVVYGSWPYPDYPPIYFPPPVGYGYVSGPAISFGIGLGIVGALWGWDNWDWGRHDIHIDDGRYNHINNYVDVHRNRPQYTQNTWQHDPTHRRGVPYSAPAIRQKYQRASAGSANARRDFRGFDNQAAAPRGPAPAAAPRPQQQQQQASVPPNRRASEARPPTGRPAAPASARTAAPPPQQRAPSPPPPQPQHAAAPRSGGTRLFELRPRRRCPRPVAARPGQPPNHASRAAQRSTAARPGPAAAQRPAATQRTTARSDQKGKK